MPSGLWVLQKSLICEQSIHLRRNLNMRKSTFVAVTSLASQLWTCTGFDFNSSFRKSTFQRHLPSRSRTDPQACIFDTQRGKPSLKRNMVSTFPNDDAVAETDQDWKDVLPFEKSAHNSATIIVPEEQNPMFDFETFAERLQSTTTMLKKMDKSSVWVHVPMKRASLIEKMSNVGFRFHHAQDTVAKLNLWLRDDTESKVPEFATHHLGVGAIVVNSRNEVLCVRELRKNYMPWKIPGGLSELGESIAEAAVREVMEETGIPTTFHSILSFRHTHGLANGRSDLYFVCRLDPVEEVDESGKIVIPEPCAQACEIEATQWVPMKEYRAMVDGADGNPGHPMMRNVMKVYDQGFRIQPKEVKSVVPGRKPNPMYMPVLISDEEQKEDTTARRSSQ